VGEKPLPFINERLAQNQQQLDCEQLEKTQCEKNVIEQGETIHKEKKVVRPSRFRFEPQDVMAILTTRIVGQPHVLQAMEDLLFTVKADFNSTQRPLSVNLFLGPTGVGKTETVRVIAEAILGNANKICRIDMNTLAQEHYSAALTGSPPGYVGSKEGQTLFNVDNIKGSFSEPGIVLFDEIEKANKDVVRAILNVLDTGKLVLTSGAKELDFSNALIFMTSNLGVRELTQHIAAHQHGWRKWLGIKPRQEEEILNTALTHHFDPEFLNRIDRVIHFNRLDEKFLDNLVDIELEKLNQRLSRRKASLTLDKLARNFLCEEYDQGYGARNVARRMRIELEPKLARALIDYPEQREFTAVVENKNLCVTPLNFSP
jgi:ATP-dependent Clp protease ATP-binding subunit ClpA